MWVKGTVGIILNTNMLPAVTHFLFFQTACKMMSCRCDFAWQLSAKKTIVYYYGSLKQVVNRSCYLPSIGSRRCLVVSLGSLPPWVRPISLLFLNLLTARDCIVFCLFHNSSCFLFIIIVLILIVTPVPIPVVRGWGAARCCRLATAGCCRLAAARWGIIRWSSVLAANCVKDE